MRETDLDELYDELPNPDNEIRHRPNYIAQAYADIGREPIVYLAPETACIREIYAISAGQASDRCAVRPTFKNIFQLLDKIRDRCRQLVRDRLAQTIQVNIHGNGRRGCLGRTQNRYHES